MARPIILFVAEIETRKYRRDSSERLRESYAPLCYHARIKTEYNLWEKDSGDPTQRFTHARQALSH
jgi:hypothetical protein